MIGAIHKNTPEYPKISFCLCFADSIVMEGDADMPYRTTRNEENIEGREPNMEQLYNLIKSNISDGL